MNAPAVVKETTTAKPTVKAYQELQDAYDFFNERLFDGELPDMLITLQRGKKTFGYFSPNRFSGKSDHSEIAMNPDFFAARSLCDTLSPNSPPPVGGSVECGVRLIAHYK